MQRHSECWACGVVWITERHHVKPQRCGGNDTDECVDLCLVCHQMVSIPWTLNVIGWALSGGERADKLVSLKMKSLSFTAPDLHRKLMEMISLGKL